VRLYCMLFAVLFVALPLCAGSTQAADSPRATLSLDSGWRFSQSPQLSEAEALGGDAKDWAPVSVPHTWNRLGNEGTERSPLSNSTQGLGWYRLHFKAPRTAADSRYFLQFNAVGAIATVWLNGHVLGRHVGAFSRFRFDATEFLNRSGDNVLLVKADNTRPVPGSSTADMIPLSGDFFVFGGIYRDVSLLITHPVHADLLDYGGPGLYAHTAQIDAEGAEIDMAARVANDTPAAVAAAVQFSIEDAAGRRVASQSLSPTLNPAVNSLQARLRIDHPHLWQGTKDPYLYRAVMTIRSSQGLVLDEVRQPLGIRATRFDPDQGFFLNGEHLALHGVSRHQDRPLKGWAISHADLEQDFDLIRDLGANAVRFAHYQHDEYAYELADRHGLIAWAEIPVVNKVSFDGSPANDALSANARQQLLELIHQNFNHPSIALWSIGNEVDLTALQIKGGSQAGILLRNLQSLAKQEDPSRSTTLADCCETGLPPQGGAALNGAPPREVLAGIADTVGYNRYFGWYTGEFSDLGPMLDAAHARHPTLPISVSEYGAGAALTQHSDDARGGPINPHGRPHPEEYQNLYHEQSWAALQARPYLWATYVWNMFDFSSDSRREGDLSDINEKGLMSYDRETRKDAFYFYRAQWNPKPTLHLVGRRHVERDYAVVDVKAYSNAGEAHLTVNGAPAIAAPCAAGICIWRAVMLKPGSNELTAAANIDGHEVRDTLQWTLLHPASVVRIKAGDITGTVAGGVRYGSDLYFIGGEAGGINPPDTPPSKRTAVAGVDEALYDTFRAGDFSYRIPLPNGRYAVTLRFVEPTAAAAGERVFDVGANAATAIAHLDVFVAAGGARKALEKKFEARVEHGELLLAFKPQRGQALVSSLSIVPLDSP
jgi:beta-galactosidase